MSRSSIHLFFGEDDFLATAAAKELLAKVLPPDQQGFGLEVIDGRVDTADEGVAATEQCIGALRTAGSLWGGSQVIWLRDANFLADGAIKQMDALKASLRDLTETISEGLLPTQVLVITAEKVDKRSAFYKACSEKGEAREFSAPGKAYLAANQARKQLADAMGREGLKAGEEVLDAILERVGNDTRQIQNEVTKLALFAGERKTIRAEDVAAIVSATRDIPGWDLADAVGERDLPRALGILNQLMFQQESAIGIAGGLAARVQELLIFNAALEAGWLRVLGRTAEWGPVPEDVGVLLSQGFKQDPRGMHPYRAALTAAKAAKFSPQTLYRWQELIQGAHRRLVSSSVPKRLVLELLLIRMLKDARSGA